MKKEFYSGQPLIVKWTGKKVIFAYDDGSTERPCKVLSSGDYFCHDYYDYKQLKPSTEFKFSEIISGLEKGYFEEGTEFQSECQTFVVRKTPVGFGLKEKEGDLIDANIHAGSINGHWALVEPRKEMP